MTRTTKTVQFIVKTSKHCNLRCKYCYEYAELGNKKSISLDQVEQMYRNILSYYQTLDFPINLEFVWHGGEPLLQHPDFYWRAFDLQAQVFKDLPYPITLKNSVQTNLTLLDNQRLRLLREGFKDVGVSLDLYGGLRVDQSNRDSQNKVLENLDRLTAEGINFGCITVLTQHNLDYVEEIYNFYRTMDVGVRILPLFKGAFEDQHQGFEITPEQVLTANKKLFDLWLADEQFVQIAPVVDAIRQVVYHHTPDVPLLFYDKRAWESIYMVNTDGEVFSYADAYDPGYSHGNLFKSSLAELVTSPSHEKVLAEAEGRIIETCSGCPYFGRCTGYPMAEGNRQYNELDERGAIRCIVERGLLDYIDSRLRSAGLLESKTGYLREDMNLPQMPAALAIAR